MKKIIAILLLAITCIWFSNVEAQTSTNNQTILLSNIDYTNLNYTAQKLYDRRIKSREKKYTNILEHCNMDLYLTYEKDWFSTDACGVQYTESIAKALERTNETLGAYSSTWDKWEESWNLQEIVDVKDSFQKLYDATLDRETPYWLSSQLWYEIIRIKIEQTILTLEIAQTYVMNANELRTMSMTLNDTPKNTINLNSLNEAIGFMYQQWLTKYSTQSSYSPYNNITREQFAKFITTFAQTNYQTNKQWTCSFTDIRNADPTLVSYIYEWCELGIMKWANQLFRPFDQVTTIEALVTILRLEHGNIDTNTSDRYSRYLPYINQYGLLENISSWLHEPINRGDIAKIFYKYYYLTH